MMANNIVMGRSSSSSNGLFKADTVGQRMISLIANLCFALFVIGVVVFTILAATYQPEDPFLQPSKSITAYLTSTSNATFTEDESVVRTGEDFVPKGQEVQVQQVETKPISIAEVKAEEVKASSENSICDTKTIDCSDHEVGTAMMKFALEKFQDIKYYGFGKPVQGSNESTCDMSWRFKPKVGRSDVLYKDYRRFSLQIADPKSCNYTVVGVGDWHSGKKARKRKHKKPAGFVPERLKPLTEMPAVGEVVNDSVPVVKSEGTFSKGKYLMYSRGGDYCKPMSQYLWSFLCALGEARYLNRIFVMELDVCLSGSNNPGHPNEEGKDFRFYFDFEHLKESASVIDQAQFWMDWNKWQKQDGLNLNMVNDFKITPVQLKEDQSTLIWRKFEAAEPDNYWYRVCEGEMENVIQRPWDLIWKSRRLMEIVSAISTRMNWDFDSVHVVRGDKATNKDLWPNLDQDTSPDALLRKLRYRIDENRDVYIATNEMDTRFFEPLRSTYKLHFLDDFRRSSGKPMASSALHSVFDEAVLHNEFKKRGINLRFIPVIWKYLLLNEKAEVFEVPGLSNAAYDVLRTKFIAMTSTVKATVQSADQSTTKLLIQLQNGSFIEAVIMSYDTRLGTYAGNPRPGGPRATLCVSSQVGCKMGCTFCATGSMGFKSNLSAGEIVEQLVHASRISQIRNVVFMGMGEPLNNYKSVVEAVRSMTGHCFQLAPRHITISTVGVIHCINNLKYDLPNVNLAVSLHAPLQEVRCQIMPAARAFPLGKLMDALRAYQEHSKRKIFIEYIMLDGINDQEQQAHLLGKLLEEYDVVVNLIPFNPIGSISKYRTSKKENVELFQKILRGVYNIRTTVRQEMGQDISGACGQLVVNLSDKNLPVKMEYSGKPEGIPDIEDLSILRS